MMKSRDSSLDSPSMAAKNPQNQLDTMKMQKNHQKAQESMHTSNAESREFPSTNIFLGKPFISVK
jgi:hypothetical protein